MANWTIALGLACACSGGFSDELEVAWLAACSASTLEKLSQLTWLVPPPPHGAAGVAARWRKLEVALATARHGILKQSKELLQEDVVLKTREYAQLNAILGGRQIVWTRTDYCKTNRTLQEQCPYQDTDSLKWMGDEKLQ